jgi:hypothetical protein
MAEPLPPKIQYDSIISELHMDENPIDINKIVIMYDTFNARPDLRRLFISFY